MPRRRGDFITTYDGRQFWPLDPRAEDVYLGDIAHALSHQCRWSGHTSRFYSVAQHSLAVGAWVASRYKPLRDEILWGLLHDAAEAYLVDLPRPLKKLRGFTEFRRVERGIMRVIAERFEMGWPMPAKVKRGDEMALAAEARALMPRETSLVQLTEDLARGMELPALTEDLTPAEIRARFIAEVEKHLPRTKEFAELERKFTGGLASV